MAACLFCVFFRKGFVCSMHTFLGSDGSVAISAGTGILINGADLRESCFCQDGAIFRDGDTVFCLGPGHWGSDRNGLYDRFGSVLYGLDGRFWAGVLSDQDAEAIIRAGF